MCEITLTLAATRANPKTNTVTLWEQTYIVYSQKTLKAVVACLRLRVPLCCCRPPPSFTLIDPLSLPATRLRAACAVTLPSGLTLSPGQMLLRGLYIPFGSTDVQCVLKTPHSYHWRSNNLALRLQPGTTLSRPMPSVMSAPYYRAFPSYFTRFDLCLSPCSSYEEVDILFTLVIYFVLGNKHLLDPTVTGTQPSPESIASSLSTSHIITRSLSARLIAPQANTSAPFGLTALSEPTLLPDQLDNILLAFHY
jgi:hypothetical protein